MIICYITQFGIVPDYDRTIKAVKGTPRKPATQSDDKFLDTMRTKRTVIRWAEHGLPYPVISQLVHLSPHWVYVICRRSGIRRYRTDHYVRPARSKHAA